MLPRELQPKRPRADAGRLGLEGALAVVNGMVADGVIGDYAIGGAVAAFLYLEPGTTFDVDIFIEWTPGAGGLLSVQPSYDYLRR